MSYHKLYKPSPTYKEYVQATKNHTWNILEGSVRSAKTISNVQAFAAGILASPDSLHIVAATTSIVARAVWIENDGLGLAHIFHGISTITKFEGISALRINLPNRTVWVLMIGMSNAGSYKSFRGMSIGMVGFTELDLLDPETVEEAIRRTAASKYRRFFIDFNPCGPKHRIYGDDLTYSVDRLRDTIPEKVNYKHATLTDNPIMTEERIEEIASEYPPDSVQFQRFIQGKRVDAEGLIYRWSPWNTLNSYDVKDYIGYVLVADIGEEDSATVFLLVAITQGFEELHIIKEYYHKNAGQKGLAIKMPNDYADDFTLFIRESIELMGVYPEMVYIDHDITFNRELRKSLNRNEMANIRYKYAIKDEIDDRIKTGISLLWTKRLKVYEECENTIYSYKSAIYDPKLSLKGKYVRYDAPKEGTMIDCLDTAEYGITHFLKRIYRK